MNPQAILLCGAEPMPVKSAGSLNSVCRARIPLGCYLGGKNLWFDCLSLSRHRMGLGGE